MKRSYVRIHKLKRDTYESLYPGIALMDMLAVVQRIDVPPGDYIAPLVGVSWLDNSIAWLYERDTVDVQERTTNAS